MSSLLDLSRVSASQKCQRSQGFGRVVVAKPRNVVTLGLVSGVRVSKVSTVTGVRAGRGREAQKCPHFWTRLVSSRLKSVKRHRDRGAVVAKPRSVVTFLDSSRVSAFQKCQQSQGFGRVVVAKPRNVVSFRLVSGLRVSKVSTVTGIGGGVFAKPRHVLTFGLVLRLRVSKVSTVTGVGGSWSRSPEMSSLLDSSRVSVSRKCQQSHRGSGGLWSRNPEMSSLLDLSRVSVSQKCQQSQGFGRVVVAKPRNVVTLGLVSGVRVSKVSTVTGIGGVVVVKPRTVVTLGLVSIRRVSKVSTVTGIGEVVVAKPRIVVFFGLASGEERGERRKDR